MKKLALCILALLLAPQVWAGTYYGGFEDRIGGDYDFNDLVFRIDGAKMTTSGTWSAKPAVDNNGSPFWDHNSGDGGDYNIGFCVYGGGVCGRGYAPSSLYLATTAQGSVNDVMFTSNGAVTADIFLKVAGDTALQLGWRDSSSVDHWFAVGTGDFTFTPHGSFELIGTTSEHNVFGSNHSMSDSESHFAFFAVPEPASLTMLGCGLVGLLGTIRRKYAL